MFEKKILSLENITFQYDKIKVIDNVTASFEKGKFYGILGPNGSGKTTLLDLIINYKKSYNGKIYINNRNICKYSKNELAKNIAIVPQDFYIKFPFTVKEIIGMGRYPHIPRFSMPSKEDREIVDSIIFKLNLSGIKDKYITQLSGGERQRVIFASVLVQNTPILLIDEGTSNLDIKYSEHILNYVKKMVENEKKTVIAVFHNLNLATLFCDNLIFIKTGKVMAIGKTDDVFTEEIINATFDINCHIYVEKHTGKKQMVFK